MRREPGMGSALKRLLLVDDDARNLAVLEARLQMLGHRLVLASGGEAAIRAFDAERPDLVLLDLAMPGIDGYAVLAHIRAAAADSHVPVILITAHTEREHRLRCLQAGADDFLEKPIDGPILIARVRALLALKQARDELQDSRDALAARTGLLERLQREQCELMQFIIHDLKTPISLITVNLQLVKESAARGDLETTTATLLDVEEGARQLRSMVNDLLIVSRLEESTFPVAPEVLRLDDLLHPIVSSYARRAEQKHITVMQGPEIDCKVMGDRSLLRRVLENLLENSLRYTPVFGRVGLHAYAAEAIQIAVSNDGPPIPEHDRDRIFEKFARGSSEPPLSGSTGLGLYFCKRAIEAHGGRIGVHQSSEWPTRFVIQLPRYS